MTTSNCRWRCERFATKIHKIQVYKKQVAYARRWCDIKPMNEWVLEWVNRFWKKNSLREQTEFHRNFSRSLNIWKFQVLSARRISFQFSLNKLKEIGGKIKIMSWDFGINTNTKKLLHEIHLEFTCMDQTERFLLFQVLFSKKKSGCHEGASPLDWPTYRFTLCKFMQSGGYAVWPCMA